MSNARNLADLLGTNTLIQPSNLNLTANYAFTGTVTGTSDFVLLDSDSTGASNVAYADVTLSQSTDYHHQILVVNGYYNNNDAQDMAWQVVEGGSAITASSSYFYQYIGRRYGVSTEGGSSHTDGSFRFNWYAVGNGSGEMSDLYIKIFNAPTSSLRTTFHAEVNGISNDGNTYTNYASATRNGYAVCEKIRMRASAGNIYYSNYALYGVKL